MSFSYDPRLPWFWWDMCIAYQSWTCQLHTSVVCGMDIAANLDLFEWSAPLSKPTEPFLLMTHSWAAIKHCVTISHTALSGDLFNYLNLPTCPKYGSFPSRRKVSASPSSCVFLVTWLWPSPLSKVLLGRWCCAPSSIINQAAVFTGRKLVMAMTGWSIPESLTCIIQPKRSCSRQHAAQVGSVYSHESYFS